MLLYQFDASGSTDAMGLFSDDFEAINNIWLTVGAAYVATPRNYYVSGHSGTDGAISSATLDQLNQYVLPRLGLLWDMDTHLQLFTSYGGNAKPKQDLQGTYGPSSSITLYPNGAFSI